MRKFLTSLLGQSQASKQLTLCKKHIPSDPLIPHSIPYNKDQCLTCQAQFCHICSQTHIGQQCDVKLNINKELGTGPEKDFNLGHMMKVDLRNLRCICGKPLGKNAAICAACGLASCSQSCHSEWQKAGMCKFRQNFYSTPQNHSMRSITFRNIDLIRNSQMDEWAIANKSGTTMISCYVSNQHPYVFLQRGYRNYGRPHDSLLNIMEKVDSEIDFYTHYQRRCSCQCEYCVDKNKRVEVHPAINCQEICNEGDFQFLKTAVLNPQFQKQCECDCSFCRSGVVVSTHQKLDCLFHCEKSQYNQDQW